MSREDAMGAMAADQRQAKDDAGKTAQIFYGGFRRRGGGAFNHARICEIELRKRGWNAQIVTLETLPLLLRYLPHIAERTLNAVMRPYGFLLKGFLTRKLFRWFARKPADLYIFEDIYITWEEETPALTIFHAAWTDNLQAFTVNENNVRKVIGYEIDLINRISHPVVTVSCPYLNYVKQDLFQNRVSREIGVILQAVDLPELGPVSRGHKSLVYCGAIEARKNVHMIIEMYARLVAIDPEFRLTIVGDGPQRREVEDLAKYLGVAPVFLGKLPNEDAIHEVARHDIYVHTSSKESFSFALLEAKLLGLATCAHAGLEVPAEFIDFGVKSFDVADWVDAVLQAHSKGPVHHVDAEFYSLRRMMDEMIARAA